MNTNEQQNIHDIELGCGYVFICSVTALDRYYVHFMGVFRIIIYVKTIMWHFNDLNKIII